MSVEINLDALCTGLETSIPAEGAATVVPKAAEDCSSKSPKEKKKKSRRGSRGKKYRGEHLVCSTDVWNAADESYSALQNGTTGTLRVCTRDVNCHDSNEAWELVTDLGVVLCFIAKEHGLDLVEGRRATLSHVISRKGYKGATLKFK